MTDQEARYDRIAEGYATWWSPVHRRSTLDLLRDVEPDVRRGAWRLLDVGCGTGALAAAAAARWPDVEVDGIDASDGMLAIARREQEALPGAVRRRITYQRAAADRLPFDDGTFDVVVSAFVLQLVPSRARALREMRRVLRPGGLVAYVAWLQGEAPFAADLAYDEALLAAGLEPRVPGGEHDDIASPAAAIAQLRRAGLRAATARGDALVHQFSVEAFVGFVTRFDDEDLFAGLDPAARNALETDLVTRLRALPPDDLRLVLPIVYAGARRP